MQITCKRNYRKHLLRVHGIGATNEMPRTVCSECRESFETLGHAREHIATKHIIEIETHCVFCNSFFPSYQAYQTHMQQEHWLPPCKPKNSNNIEGGISATLQQSAFGGELKKFDLVLEKGDVDMLSLKMNKKEAINWLISDHEIGLVKFVKEDDQSHKTTLFVNTVMYHLFFGGVSVETISAMVDQMVNTITMFGSQGSGWMIDENSRVNICLAKLSPIRARSYIPLPPNLKKQQRNVLNVHNTSDHNRIW